MLSATAKISTFFFLLYFCGFARAHNGKTTLVYPIENISIDGDLSDWPADFSWHDIKRIAAGTHPSSPADLTARFKIGYNQREKALYVAVQVRDESTVLDTTRGPDWYVQDGCEIYLDASHHRRNIPFDRYAIFGPYARAFPRDGGRDFLATTAEVSLKVKRDGDLSIYEWRVDVGSGYGEDISFESGAVLAFDLAVFDTDIDGETSWVSWGGGIAENDDVELWMGDILLVDKRDEMGTLSGRITWREDQSSWRRGRVRVGRRYLIKKGALSGLCSRIAKVISGSARMAMASCATTATTLCNIRR